MALYAIALDWPGTELTIQGLKELDAAKIKSRTLLDVKDELDWNQTDSGLNIKNLGKKPCEHAYSFKIVYDGRLLWTYSE